MRGSPRSHAIRGHAGDQRPVASALYPLWCIAQATQRRWCARDCKYHLVWVTKYRYQVLGGDVGQRCRELLRETARAHEMVVHAGSINRDHVHLLLSIPPSLSVSRAVQYLKGRSSHKLLSEFASLRKRYWGQHLWARGYWVASSGNVTDEVWAEYIKNQTPPEPDDDFNVT